MASKIDHLEKEVKELKRKMEELKTKNPKVAEFEELFEDKEALEWEYFEWADEDILEEIKQIERKMNLLKSKYPEVREWDKLRERYYYKTVELAKRTFENTLKGCKNRHRSRPSEIFKCIREHFIKKD